MPRHVAKIKQRLLAAGMAAAHAADAVTIIEGDVRCIELAREGRMVLQLSVADLYLDSRVDFSEHMYGPEEQYDDEPECMNGWIKHGWELSVYYDDTEAMAAAKHADAWGTDDDDDNDDEAMEADDEAEVSMEPPRTP